MKPKVTIKSVVTHLNEVIREVVETTGDISLHWDTRLREVFPEDGKEYDLNLVKCEYDHRTNTLTLLWSARKVWTQEVNHEDVQCDA